MAALGVTAMGWPVGEAFAATAVTCEPNAGLIAITPIVFVGTVANVRGDGTVATFRVEEVWGNEALDATVQLSGDFGVWSGSTEDRYLIFATPVDSGLALVKDPPCRGFFVMDPRWEDFRPATAHPPAGLPPTPATEADLPVPLLLAGGTLAVIGLVSVIAFRRRSPAA